MNELRALLTSADPAADAPDLPAGQAVEIRRAVLAAAGRAAARRSVVPGAVPIAALVVVMMAAGVTIGVRLAPVDEGPAAPAPQSAAQDERRQLQFATPGGTRIIWTLDPEFELERGTP